MLDVKVHEDSRRVRMPNTLKVNSMPASFRDGTGLIFQCGLVTRAA